MARFKVHRSRTHTALEEGEYLHSVIPQRGLLTRGVWDAIAAAALLQDTAETPRRILLLGVGGGSVLRLWDRILPHWSWVGVEIDATARRLFRDEFGPPKAPGELHAGCALAYLRSSRRRFDVIVDDLFHPRVRPTFDEPDWLALVRRRLKPGGLLVTNLVWEDERPAANRAYFRELRAAFDHLAQLRHEGYENRIVAASERPLRVRGLHRRFAAATGEASAWHELSARSLSRPRNA